MSIVWRCTYRYSHTRPSDPMRLPLSLSPTPPLRTTCSSPVAENPLALSRLLLPPILSGRSLSWLRMGACLPLERGHGEPVYQLYTPLHEQDMTSMPAIYSFHHYIQKLHSIKVKISDLESRKGLRTGISKSLVARLVLYLLLDTQGYQFIKEIS